ncbi:MAG: hypothetical protein J6040_04830 [Clostridiales bacterium]|nr:hypothetical protein [Clostridiales bacterium]
MIEEKTCQKCGANLKYDAIRKTFVCPFCGTTDQKKATLQEVDEAIANSAFSMAKTKLETLKEESPDDPRLILREIRCEIGCPNIASHLLKNRKNTEVMEKISGLSKWDDLYAQLSYDEGKFISDVKKYCKVASGVREAYKMIGDSKSAGRSADHSPYVIPAKPESVFSQMVSDAKEAEENEQAMNEKKVKEKAELETAIRLEMSVGLSIVAALVGVVILTISKRIGAIIFLTALVVGMCVCFVRAENYEPSYSHHHDYEKPKLVKYAGTTAISETTQKNYEETIKKGESVLDELYPKIAEAEKKIEF